MVEDSEGDIRFANPPYTDESDWGDVLCEADDLLDQPVTSEADPWRWGWRLLGCTRFKYKALDQLVVYIVDRFKPCHSLDNQ